ncbi:hypothetical protein ACODM8_11465 [Vibrio ostreicida]|uniref:hypothetical protein n=1 Tax=Vibrio ostreicida TaxID=526588 RepID=UPI003B58D042
MVKRLCKLNRHQIAEDLNDIHRLVAAPSFVCRSCARSSAKKASLCKPTTIPLKESQSIPVRELHVAETLPTTASGREAVTKDRLQEVGRVVERVKSNVGAEMSTEGLHLDVSDKKAFRKAQKALKKQYKGQLKLLKLARKQKKLQKKEQKIKARLNTSCVLERLPAQESTARVAKVH